MNQLEAQVSRITLSQAAETKRRLVKFVENANEMVLVWDQDAPTPSAWTGIRSQAVNDNDFLDTGPISEDLLMEAGVIDEKIDPEVVRLQDQAKKYGFKLVREA